MKDRRVALVLIPVLLLALWAKRTQQDSSAAVPEQSSIVAQIQADEQRYAGYQDEVLRFIQGNLDMAANTRTQLSELPGFFMFNWENTKLGDSVMVTTDPKNRGVYFLEINGFHGEPDAPENAAYLAENQVRGIGRGTQAVYWCVDDGPLKGAALSTSWDQSGESQTVQLRSPQWQLMRPNSNDC